MGLAELATGLTLDSRGIWVSSDTGTVSYPEDAHRHCYQLEDKSFWFAHRNNCIMAAIKRFPPPGPVLDIGGGNGYVTRRMLDDGVEAALLEPGADGAVNAKVQRQIPEVLCSTLEDARFESGSLGAVGCFDVIEHIEDDSDFIMRLHTVLQPGGLLYATVPAHQWLWSSNDVIAGHYRRYTRAAVEQLVRPQFELLYATYFFGALVWPIFLFRALPFRCGWPGTRRTLSNETAHNARRGGAAKALHALLDRERTRISGGKVKDFGASLLFVARKK